MRYNQPMRMLLVTLLLSALPLLAVAADCAGGCVDGCGCQPECDSISFITLCLSGPSHCPPAHKCPDPYIPCAPCIRERCADHKLPVYFEPCAPRICLREVCHKPAVVVTVVDPCAD
jgi:hypothetical protein